MIRSAGLEKDAESLAGADSATGVCGRLAAASLLQRHSSAAAVQLLQRLARDPEPAVAARAVARLLEIDPALVAPVVELLFTRPDARVRLLAVEVVLRQPTPQRVRLLRDHLDDPHPEVRIQARLTLEELAQKKGYRKQVIEEATGVLASDEFGGRTSWRGLEQAAILVARLDHKPAGERLVELLSSRRPEVFLTAAWALRKLAVANTLEGVSRYVRVKQRELRAAVGAGRPFTVVMLDHQLSQLNQLLGQQKHGSADAVLREFIPRMETSNGPPGGEESRAAAIWALGVIHEGKTVAELVPVLINRLNDRRPPLPEDARVRRMAAITLARMKATRALPSLRYYCPDRKPSLNPLANACGWAIAALTGEAMLPAETIRTPRRDWFLRKVER
jgi:HEAT repeat protein